MSDVGIKVEELRQIGVAKPGDVIVLTFGRRITDQEFQEMRDRWHAVFPDLRIAIFDACAEVTIVRPEEAGTS